MFWIMRPRRFYGVTLVTSSILFFGSQTLMGQAGQVDQDSNPVSVPEQQSEPSDQKLSGSSPQLSKNLGYFWLPLASSVIPGLGQLAHGEYVRAGSYTGLYLLSQHHLDQSKEEFMQFRKSSEWANMTQLERENEYVHGDMARKVSYAAQVRLLTRSFSAWETFRASLPSLQASGKFTFIKDDDSVSDLAMAPFQFDFLKRKTTWIPLAIGAALYYYSAVLVPQVNTAVSTDPLTGADTLYTLGTSWNAGTHEEMAFRGWLMPMLMEQTGDPISSNLISGALFGGAHLNHIDAPLFQISLGWYLGWVTIRNQWRLSEAVFIHAWWDVFALLVNYQTRNTKLEGSANMLPLMLPPLKIVF